MKDDAGQTMEDTIRPDSQRGDGYVNATQMCQDADRVWASFAQSTKAKACIQALSSSLNMAPTQLVRDRNGGQHSGVWIHESLAPFLTSWLYEGRPPRGVAGYIYTATSDVLDAVKIGRWRGSLESLRSRYITPYGPKLQLHTQHVKDCLAAEELLHKHFQASNLGGELFCKSRLREYHAEMLTQKN